MIKLSKRMKAVADLVSEGNKVADIGCDHGYLPIYLVQEKKAPSAVAMDVNQGPLNAAREHIISEGLEAVIETRLSDGLTNLKDEEGESVIIAGMGGPLIINILMQNKELLGNNSQIKEFILQPQSELTLFRKTMRELGFVCQQEDMVFEDGKYYPMGRYVRGVYDLDVEHILGDEYGPLLLKNKNDVLRQYLDKELRNLKQIEQSLQNMQEEDAKQERLKQVLAKMKLNEEARGFFN